MLLLGSHSDDTDSLHGLDKEDLGRLAADIRNSATSQRAGYSDSLMDLLMESLRTHLSIRRALLER